MNTISTPQDSTNGVAVETALRTRLEALQELPPSPTVQVSLEELLGEAERLGSAVSARFVLDLENELGDLKYSLDPKFEEALDAISGDEPLEAFKRFKALMEEADMPPGAYPVDYDKVLLFFCEGIPSKDEFKSEIVGEFELWTTINGFLPLQACQAVSDDDAIRAAYILALCFEYDETAIERLGVARAQFIYDLYKLVDKFKAQAELS
ncbi:MAG: hypothetical protein ACOH18_02885 [Candidatus Saccharimonadaceae bacterium]